MGKTKLTDYKQGDIVWVDYPFSQSPENTKHRPAVIISNTDCHKNDSDIILCPITTVLRVTPFSFFLDRTTVTRTVNVDCEVRCNKVFTLSKNLLQGRMSEILPSKIEELIKLVYSAIEKK